MSNFKDFINKSYKEWADYGFAQPIDDRKPKQDTHDKPMVSLQIDYVTDQLRKIGVGIKEARKDDFAGDIHWGDGPGSITVNFSPFAGLRATVKKITNDLHGESTWICEKVIRIWDYENPDRIIDTITESVREVDKGNLPSPSKEYDKLENLAIEIASKINRHPGYTGKPIFMYNGIRVVNQNEQYIIMYDITGMGRQAAGQTYVHQYQVFVEFDKHKGFIKITGNNLADKLSSWTWQYQPSEFCEYFSIQQERKSICECVANLIRSY